MTTKNIAKRLLALPALLSLALASCLHDNDFGECTPNTGGGEATVTFALNVPGNSNPATRAGLSETDETNVETIDVLLFNLDGGDRVYYGKVLGVSLDNTAGSTKSFKAVIPVKDYSNYDITIVANGRERILAAGLTRGEAKAVALDKLTLDISLAANSWTDANKKWTSNKIPMWGEAQNVTVNENTNLSGTNAVKMTRMVARIDVQLSRKAATGSDEPDATGNANFRLASVRLYNYSQKGTLAPDLSSGWNPGDGTNPPRATAPHAPSGGYAKALYDTYQPLVYTSTDQHTTAENLPNSLIRAIYTLEAPAGSSAALATNTCLVIGGKFGTSDTETYYRIDFVVKNNQTQQYDYLHLLRNHRYIINITKISGAGFGTPEDAFYSRPVNIEADILAWNELDMNDITSDGLYQLTVNRSSFAYNADGAAQTLKVYTDWSGGWQIKDEDKPSWVTVTPAQGAAGATTSVSVSLSAITDADEPRADGFYITAGRIRKLITVTQNNIIPRWEITSWSHADNAVIANAGANVTATASTNMAWTLGGTVSAGTAGTNQSAAASAYAAGKTLTYAIPAYPVWTNTPRIIMLTAASEGFTSQTRFIRQPGYTATFSKDKTIVARAGEELVVTVATTTVVPEFGMRVVVSGTSTVVSDVVDGTTGDRTLTIGANAATTPRTLSVEFYNSTVGAYVATGVTVTQMGAPVLNADVGLYSWTMAVGMDGKDNYPQGVCPDGYRVPTQNELKMMWINYPGTPELNLSTNYYWSATECSSTTSDAWSLNFNNSNTVNRHKTYPNYSVRCVAAERTDTYPYVDTTTDPTNGPIIVSRDANGGIADGSIHENWTTTPAHNEASTTENTVSAKLQVANDNQGTTMNWTAATTACTGGWRLPTQRELQLIWVMGGAADTRYNAASATVQQRNPPLDTTNPLYGLSEFAPLDANLYWSATEYSVTNNAWYVSFIDGRPDNYNSKTNYFRVRCVRDVAD